MKVSVALCTYNGERFLAEQLASIRRQTRLPDEVVIRDDGSTDQTVDIIQRFALDFPGDVDFAVNPTRLGVSGNFDAALRATTGEIVLLSDQDDVWYPQRVDQARARFQADSRLRLLFADARLIDAAGDPLGDTQMNALGMREEERMAIEQGRAFGAFCIRNLPLGATACIHHSVLEDALPIPPSWLHDEWIALIAAARGKVVYLDEPVIDYRQHGGNVLGAPSRTLRGKVRAIFSPKRDIRSQMVARDQALLERIRSMGAPSELRALCEDKLAHARVRGHLLPSRLSRIRPVLREVLTGRYQRFSTGWQSVVVDLLRPIN